MLLGDFWCQPDFTRIILLIVDNTDYPAYRREHLSLTGESDAQTFRTQLHTFKYNPIYLKSPFFISSGNHLSPLMVSGELMKYVFNQLE